MDLTKYYPDIVAKYPAYVTKRELCEICHICPKTAYNLEQQGEIPYTIEQNHLIRSHKIKLTDILAYLYRRECRQEADSPYICAMRTFYDKHLSPYCEAKQRAKEHLSAITDEMIDEFEQYMEHLHPQEYRRLREAFGRITDDELGTSPLDSVVGAMKIAPFISRLFALKEKMPKKGRLYYKLLPEDVKAELDAFVAFLKENNEYIRNLVQDYAESKTRLAMLYDTDPAHIKEQQEKAVAEADKLIANKILDVIRTMLCKDREVQSFEYTEARKAYFTEQMICEILIALEQTAMSLDMEYDDRQKAMSTDLSKAARKEWYLRHKDKGMEP